MEICRSIRIVNRLLRKPFGITAYRNVTGTAVKEEASTELVNTYNRDIKLGKLQIDSFMKYHYNETSKP